MIYNAFNVYLQKQIMQFNLPCHKVVPIGGQKMSYTLKNVFFWTMTRKMYPTTGYINHWQTLMELHCDKKILFSLRHVEICSNMGHDIDNGVSAFNKGGSIFMFLQKHNYKMTAIE